jgi:hypothetical protein
MNLRVILGLVLACLTLPATAMFVFPPEAPVDRLAQNVAAYVKDHPDDAMGYYTLGRIHHLAFALKQDKLRATERSGKLPTVPAMFNSGSPAKDSQLSDAALAEHARAAVENYTTALTKDRADNPLFHLGLASVLESAWGSTIELAPIPGYKADKEVKDWKPIYLNESIRHYLKAYDGAVDKDLKVEYMPLAGISSLVSYEAGTHYVGLADKPDVEKDLAGRADEVKASVAKLRAKPHGAVTPIVFSLSADRSSLADLLDAEHTVTFDLDGSGRGQSWPWVKPATTILVWDPTGTGKIESGRQLFGSVTWWIFWRDGYAALDALDDDRDGQLSGAELRGLAAWTDRNGNGVADPGEVVSLESLGVESIAVRATGHDGESPCNRAGLRMKDGRTLATFDWVAHPASETGTVAVGQR